MRLQDSIWYQARRRRRMSERKAESKDCPQCGEYIRRAGLESTWDIVNVCKLCNEAVCRNPDCLTAHVVMVHSSD